MKSKPSTTRLSADQVAQVEAIAQRLGCSTGEVIRRAVDQFLRGQKLISDSDARLRRVCEYAQLALDVMIQEDLPERRDGILLEVNNRMERYHGAR
ncbi:ribbon-helix-helix protein, CopG family [Sphingomonas pituitosa]|uniref:ribbon-helix-helix protein, CopG family n=1 Tax=Sphingomonas pituitosa TaxID=99597 RepID=UPI000A079AF7|nr:ribbon-helix-helix protein, CopG family [Sphingomonas pituitosa]